jgi:hypothetical protein
MYGRLAITVLAGLLSFSAAIVVPAWAEGIDTGLEQEFIDAKNAVAAANKNKAGNLAASQLKRAEEYLQTAESARNAQDVTNFARSLRLARAYAEFASASSELSTVNEQLAAANVDMLNAKSEIERLIKLQ